MENIKFLIILLVLSSLYEQKVLPYSDLSPCMVESIKNYDYGYITCDARSNINSASDLKKLFHNTTDTTHVYNLLIEDAKLEYLNETAIFGNFEFERIFIISTKTKWISNDALKGQNSLHELTFMENAFERFNFEVIRSVNISVLRIIHNQLVDIPSNSFIPTTEFRFREIDFTSNKLQTIGKLTFNELPNLRSIDLSRNKITTIEGQAFHLLGSHEPLHIHLYGNNLTSDGIHKDAFPAGLKLQRLDLSHNQLTSLPIDIFEPILEDIVDIEDSSLEVFGNPFVCDTSLDWLVRKPENVKNIIRGLICPNGKTLQVLTLDDLEN